MTPSPPPCPRRLTERLLAAQRRRRRGVRVLAALPRRRLGSRREPQGRSCGEAVLVADRALLDGAAGGRRRGAIGRGDAGHVRARLRRPGAQRRRGCEAGRGCAGVECGGGQESRAPRLTRVDEDAAALVAVAAAVCTGAQEGVETPPPRSRCHAWQGNARSKSA